MKKYFVYKDFKDNQKQTLEIDQKIKNILEIFEK